MDDTDQAIALTVEKLTARFIAEPSTETRIRIANGELQQLLKEVTGPFETEEEIALFQAVLLQTALPVYQDGEIIDPVIQDGWNERLTAKLNEYFGYVHVLRHAGGESRAAESAATN